MHALVVASALGTLGCAEVRYGRCAEPPRAALEAAPPKLSETGLFRDLAKRTLAPGVVAYQPRFAVWSDGAEKRRWIYLPPGTRIDTRDMDAWQFPVGTKLWKEFTRDGVRVETRLLHKTDVGPADWTTLAYVWDREGNEAVATPAGLENAHGTAHDVPAARTCNGCHGGRASRVLGVSAIQLPETAPENELSLTRLAREDRLTTALPTSLRLPGDENTQRALGYLHANCGHCHNQQRPPSTGPRCFDPRTSFDLSLRVDRLASVAQTPAYATTVGSVITAGDPDGSALFRRIAHDRWYAPRMPALGAETVDAEGLRVLRTWIAGLGAAPADARDRLRCDHVPTCDSDRCAAYPHEVLVRPAELGK